nr:PREDICTED: uncharacterized protein LOC103312473 [Tribolium castaneum]|eukprot:XP_008191390.1 PREDICTED: uncharacterized protein LOC103312473 [Tribolium castaneum]
MNKATLVLLALYVFYLNSNVEADYDIKVHPPHMRRKPSGCYNELVGHLKDGEFKTLHKTCELMRCYGRKYLVFGGGNILRTSCPLRQRKCIDPKKPFPGCCPEKCRRKLRKKIKNDNKKKAN